MTSVQDQIDVMRAPARWSAAKRQAFSLLSPAALVLVATDGPVSVTLTARDGTVTRLGHNRGIWPARIAKTGAWRDAVSSAYDRNPFFALRAQLRWWCLTEPERDRLAASVLDMIAARAERDGGLDALRHDFADLGPELDFELFELEVHDAARRLGIVAFDDAWLSQFLDRVMARAEAIRLEGQQARRREDDVLGSAVVHELERYVAGRK